MTTPALARTAAKRLRDAAIRIDASASELANADANLSEVFAAIDAWEKATSPTPDGWRTARDYDCSYTEGYDHASGAWCRKLAGEKREWYVGATPNADGSLHMFKNADEAKEYALAMVKP